MRYPFVVMFLASWFAAAPTAAQDWAAEPTFGTITLRAGFLPDPSTRSIQAGGPDLVSLSAEDCAGYINNSAPDLDLNYAGGEGVSDLYIYASADADLTLVINAPDGSWRCNDDWSTTDPLVHFPGADDGNYNIWVGTFSRSGLVAAEVFISELDPGLEDLLDDDFSAGDDTPAIWAAPTFGTLTLSTG